MALTDALDRGADSLKKFGQQMAAVSGTAVTVQVNGAGSGSDRDEAEAIKRGQRPELLAAMRKALGL